MEWNAGNACWRRYTCTDVQLTHWRTTETLTHNWHITDTLTYNWHTDVQLTSDVQLTHWLAYNWRVSYKRRTGVLLVLISPIMPYRIPTYHSRDERSTSDKTTPPRFSKTQCTRRFYFLLDKHPHGTYKPIYILYTYTATFWWWNFVCNFKSLRYKAPMPRLNSDWLEQPHETVQVYGRNAYSH